jgi:hypothetical protein
MVSNFSIKPFFLSTKIFQKTDTLKYFIRANLLKYDMRRYHGLTTVTQPFAYLLDLDFNSHGFPSHYHTRLMSLLQIFTVATNGIDVDVNFY